MMPRKLGECYASPWCFVFCKLTIHTSKATALKPYVVPNH
jgi:hypothetical protein